MTRRVNSGNAQKTVRVTGDITRGRHSETKREVDRVASIHRMETTLQLRKPMQGRGEAKWKKKGSGLLPLLGSEKEEKKNIE